ncbi:hypothetical protein D3C76_1586080 [compost metagenome]
MAECQAPTGPCNEIVDGQLSQAHRSFLTDADGPRIPRGDGENQRHIVGLELAGVSLGRAAVIGFAHQRE